VAESKWNWIESDRLVVEEKLFSFSFSRASCLVTQTEGGPLTYLSKIDEELGTDAARVYANARKCMNVHDAISSAITLKRRRLTKATVLPTEMRLKVIDHLQTFASASDDWDYGWAQRHNLWTCAPQELDAA
jgi:hypothetical protein